MEFFSSSCSYHRFPSCDMSSILYWMEFSVMSPPRTSRWCPHPRTSRWYSHPRGKRANCYTLYLHIYRRVWLYVSCSLFSWEMYDQNTYISLEVKVCPVMCGSIFLLTIPPTGQSGTSPPFPTRPTEHHLGFMTLPIGHHLSISVRPTQHHSRF